MKKVFTILFIALLSLLLASCSNGANEKSGNNENSTITNVANDEETTQTTAVQPKTETSTTESSNTNSGETIDLTGLSTTVLYSELYNMLTQPDNFVGKTVKMRGTYAVYEGEGRSYYVCEVQDATACCNQGLEFVLNNADDYPEYNSESPSEIELTGVFNTYLEEGQTYVQLEDASIIVLE